MPHKSKMKPIKVNSFWGAIATFPLVQVFGYIIFQAFFSLLATPIGIVPFLFLLIYLSEQIEVFSKMENYVRSAKRIPNPNTQEIYKLILGLFFLVVWVNFVIGNYPLPKPDTGNFHTIIFYAISWGLSALITKIKKSPKVVITSKVNTDKRGLLIFILLIFFFPALGNTEPTVYLIVMLPAFAIFILLASWMVEK